MALYDSPSSEAQGLEGLHLYHFVLSNCSQRVRFALEEKGLDWESHHVDIPSNAHLTPAYQQINPNAVVPTLVHDGQVILESNDIIHLRILRSPPAGNSCRTPDIAYRKPAESLHDPLETLSKVNISAGAGGSLPCEITAGDIGGSRLQRRNEAR